MTAVLAVVAGVLAVVLGVAVVRLRRCDQDLDAMEARRRAAEQRAADAEAAQRWLTGALDQAEDAVVVYDRSGREVVRNAAAHRFPGARHGEVLAQDALADLVRAALAGRSVERELELFGPPRRVLQLQAFPLRADGEIVGAVTFTRDVSEARRIERVRRDFVANVSHELKTPVGALAVLAETMASSDDLTVIRRLAERVEREADRLARIVDDLLDLSLAEAHDGSAREHVDIALVVRDAVEHVHAAASAAGVLLHVAPSLPSIEVWCDPRQIRSALVNVLDNAIKYSSPGQPVEVRVGRDGDRVRIDVADHGVGIPARDLERIFERFYRVDRARSRETGGTGLGLSIVRHVLQAHGGEVTVQSREGEGSTFTLTLPASDPERVRPPGIAMESD